MISSIEKGILVTDSSFKTEVNSDLWFIQRVFKMNNEKWADQAVYWLGEPAASSKVPGSNPE